jgi:hypothetical protein
MGLRNIKSVGQAGSLELQLRVDVGKRRCGRGAWGRNDPNNVCRYK